MNPPRLILRSLAYFRGVNLAVIAGVAAATAVLGGALMVGDSVRQSLRDLAIQRLGPVDEALLANRFFNTSLARRLAQDPDIRGRFDFAPAIILHGSAANGAGGADGGRTGGVQVIAVADGLPLSSNRSDWPDTPAATCTLNAPAAEALRLLPSPPAADVLFSLPAVPDISPDAILARRSRQDVLTGLRARVRHVVTEPGMLSLFSPTGGQRAPLNAWVNLADLQNAIGQPGRVNTLLVHDLFPTPDSAEKLNTAFARAALLSDYGLSLARAGDADEYALTSRAAALPPAVLAAADLAARDLHLELRKIAINLLRTAVCSQPDGSSKQLHYVIAAGISPLLDPPLMDDEIALNTWTADRLAAKVGDRITFDFYTRQPDGSLATQPAPHGFRVVRILPMTGLAADPSLTPAYKGLTDADTVADWNPPEGFDFDKKLVTPADEEYWKQHKAAPKIFLTYAAAQKLWSTPAGDDATSLRLPAGQAAEFSRRLLSHLDPAAMGLVFRPLRQEQLAAAAGATDFAELFVSFSFFLVVAAALLTAMLMRLSVEQRARQFGLLAALGFGPRRLRRLMLAEGMVLSLLGGLIGSAVAVGYTWLMMAGLRTCWLPAIGTTAMRLHVVPMTLLIGFVSAEIVALLAILWAVRRVARVEPARLLAGGWETAKPPLRPKHPLARLLNAIVPVLVAIGLATTAITHAKPPTAFLIIGSLLLIASLWRFGIFLSRRRIGTRHIRSITGLSLRNATRRPARSLLSVGLIALAAFALVTVAAMRQGEPTDTADLRSAAGGFTLIAETDIPLPADPSTSAGRRLLAFRDPAADVWSRARFTSLRLRPGQDISCLNLTRAVNPAILAVPPAAFAGRFTFAAAPHAGSSPWALLNQPDPAGDIPVFADDSTAQYILHLELNQSLAIVDSTGRPRRLRLVATLAGSIFQGRLLMGASNFQKLFPDQSGFGIVLVEAPAADRADLQRLLSDELGDFAASVRPTYAFLAGYLQVQNTYLSTFELLGALGLMLGTVGLSVVLVRTIIERRAELALLAAVGFPARQLLRVILVENTFLLAAGLALGTLCAVVAVLPALIASARSLNLPSLALTLFASLAVGLTASTVAARLNTRRLSPADLRRE